MIDEVYMLLAVLWHIGFTIIAPGTTINVDALAALPESPKCKIVIRGPS